jgi:hypothetical protein
VSTVEDGDPGSPPPVGMPDVLRRIAATPGCTVAASEGLPVVADPLRLPADLVAFYRWCGGVTLYEGSDHPIRIVGPAELRPANEVILAMTYPDDPSCSWYVIARTPEGDHLSIDLSPGRLGRCYECFHVLHGIRGGRPVVATSFPALLHALFRNEGRHWYWLDRRFRSLGDAYD